MTKTQMHERLVAAGYTAEDFNSNNSWGFGGGIGTRYSKGEQQVRMFTAYYRVGPAEAHIDSTKPVRGAIASPTNKDLDRVAAALGI